MSDAARSRLRFLKALNEAMLPSRIIGVVEKCSYLREAGVFVKGCSLRRVRPAKDGAQLQYRFRLVNSRTAHEFTTTIIGRIYYDEKGERKYKKLLKRLRFKGAPFPDASLRGFALYVPELRLLLRSPSTDEELPSLQVALNPESMKPYLSVHFNAKLEHIRGCNVEILRYMPRKRCVLRYRLKAGGSSAGQIHAESFVGKIYGNREEGENVFAIMAELGRRGFGRSFSDGVRIPRPIAYIRDLHMVLMEDVRFPSLEEHLSSPYLLDHLKAAARALAKIHACPLKLARRYQVEDEFSPLRRWVSRAVQVYPDLADSFEASLTRIAASAHDLRRPEPVLVHGTFHLGHLLVNGNEIIIIDFDRLSNGDPAADIGRFLAHLKSEGSRLSWAEEETRSRSEVFLAAYRPCISPEMRKRIDFYYRMFLVRSYWKFSFSPEWRRLTASLLAEVSKGSSF